MRNLASESPGGDQIPGAGFRRPSRPATFNSEHGADVNDDVTSDSDTEETQITGPLFHSRLLPNTRHQPKGNRHDRLRKDLHSKISKDLKNGLTRETIQEDNKARTQECMIDGAGKSSNILHWIARKLEGLSEDERYQFDAGLELAFIALGIDSHIISTIEKNSGDTALHVIVGSKTLEQLAVLVCQNSSAEDLRTAIQAQNNRRENCLHVVIASELDVATQLIEAADVKAFTMQRKAIDSNGKPLRNDGNTPLHDAVAYGQCRCEEPVCLQTSNCLNCLEAEIGLRNRQTRVMDMIMKLVNRNDTALTIKNSADESPYLYLQSTVQEADKDNVSNKKQPPPSFNDQQGKTTTTKDEHSSRPAQKTNPPQANVRGSASVGKPDPPASKPSQRTGSPGPGSTTEKSKSDAKGQAPHQPASITDQQATQSKGSCALKKSLRIVKKVEEYLEESSFALGSFEQACACFFGKNPDKDGRDPTFRPVRSIGSDADACYDFIKFTKIMSQVELRVSSRDPTYAAASSGELQESPEERWERFMESLQKIFRMLYKNGARKILKLTVIDNPKRPCSDEVIERCLSGFDVRYLNWVKPDLCADVILAKAPKVVELWLYSSGSNAVLRGWAATNGLCGLNQLMALNLNAKRDLENYTRYAENVDTFVEELEENVHLCRTKLYLIAERESIDEQIRDVQMEMQVWEEYKKKCEAQKQEAESKLQRCQTELGLDKGDMKKNKRYVERYPTWQKKLEKQSKECDKCINAVKKQLDSLQSNEQHATKEIRQFDEKEMNIEEARMKKKRATGRGQHNTQNRGDYHEVAEAKTEAAKKPRQGRLPTLFPITSGYVTGKHDIRSIKEQPPIDRRDSYIELKLERACEPPGKQHRWMDSVKAFANNAVSSTNSSGRDGKEIKVALIDDGVDASLPDFIDRIFYPGWPREPPTSERSPFYHSSTGHGTEMAKLIKLACPKVRLYVAKLGDWTDPQSQKDSLAGDTTAKNAADAVEWAIQQKVHVISMSWSLISTRENENQIALLDAKVQKAARNNIIMYCAAADKGLYEHGQNLFPKKADTHHIKAVGSANERGLASTFLDPDQVDYLFPGEEIEELGHGRGSSAATALAAGFAALILWCFLLKAGERDKESMADPKNMHKVFHKLSYGERDKWIDVTQLLKIDGSASIDEVVEKCKGWVRYD